MGHSKVVGVDNEQPAARGLTQLFGKGGLSVDIIDAKTEKYQDAE